MDKFERYASRSATAFPIRDAPSAVPAARVTSRQAGVVNTVNSRKPVFVGCWNVRTLLQPGSQALTMRSLYDYKVDVACLSEVRLSGSGSHSVKVPGVDYHYSIYYSGYDDPIGQHGVAIALSPRANKALLSWVPVSPRILVVRLKGQPFNFTVISVYAPTLQSSEEEKDAFYGELQSTLDDIHRSDILVVAGDWNARTGPCDDSTRHVLGKFGLGQRCENGTRLVSFAGFNRLCVCNTKFQHPKRHLLTWYSNDGRTANQIDYILIRSRWMSSVEDCRVYRGAEAGNAGGSDHMLVRARVRLHLKTQRRRKRKKRLNLASLSEESTIQALERTLNNELRYMQAESSVENKWSRLRSATQLAIEQHLGFTSQVRRDWISAQTMHLSASARDARLTNSAEYRTLRRLATRSARADRRRYWTELSLCMEQASRVGDFGKVFRLIRNASRRQYRDTFLRDANGHPVCHTEGKLARWVEHFDQLLNCPIPNPLDLSPAPQHLQYEIDCDAPTESEIALIIRQLKSRKSPGEDGIPSEIYKACAPTLIPALLSLFHTIWETETVPSDWGTAVILPFLKKGDRSVCANYRGISLIDSVAKVFAILLLNRFSLERDKRTRPNQGGFRPGRGCIDQIFVLRRVLEHRSQYQQPTLACFVDFRAAFDSVDRQSLWSIMLSDGLPPKLVNLIKAYYSSTRAKVRAYGEESSCFGLTTGVRQGCPLSPVLFNYVIDWVMKASLADYQGVQVSTDFWLSDLDYADDVVVLGESVEHLQTALDRISSFAACVGLQINAAKTKVLGCNLPSPCAPLTVLGTAIDIVPAFKYLGSTLLPNGQAIEEVPLRISRARTAFLQLRSVLWCRNEVSLKTKMRVYRSAIRSILLYGCETWPLRSEDVRRLEAFDHWCLRVITRTRWTARITNAAVRLRCDGLMCLSSVIQSRRLQWFGHVLRRPATEMTKLALNPKPGVGWRRRRGGQTKTWLATVKGDMDSIGLRTVYGTRRWDKDWVAICEDLASDRRAWCGLVRDIRGAGSSRDGS